MTEETPDTDQAMREALARIAAERVARTGRLSLGSNLTRLPDEIAGLGWLTLLDCADSGIDDLRPLAELTALEILVCFGTQVHDLRPLAGLSALKILYCWSTQLRDLRPLAGLTALTKLWCSGTKVRDLRPLADLQQLAELDCFGSPIEELPDALIASPVLERLVISPGPGLAAIPSEVLSQSPRDNCLPRLRAHLADLASGAEPLREFKVIVLGNGRIGKTQICRRLRGQPFQPHANSTHGIGVNAAELPMGPGELPAILNLWDFGGQDLYHGTHALFMRTRAVFLRVWTPGSEGGDQEHGGLVFRNRPLPYCLEYIRHLGGAGSPVILVQNQCDGGRGERANLPLAPDLIRPLEEGCRHFRRIAYSALDDSGRAVLSDLGTLAGDRALYWRYGLYLYDGTSRSRALVEQVPDPNGTDLETVH